ncbi:DNA cytosine methyltransferase [Clostridium akagii]|uniref:DNA cytosine methyltransferase n=1 Tax=Clostridium akagii TaxID=91623 RepID=UPI00047AD4D3|nr:DNA (cytosine-5-)-methyltransferase [Clostridium akagii]
MITAKSYFSGAGGMDLGLTQAGIKILQSYEMDETCCNTLRSNFKHEVLQEDISKITVLDQKDADIYVGTFPCTKYSTASDIHGTRNGDDLFLHFFRHIALAKPEMYIVENVPGMRKFRIVMEALTKLPDYYVRVECPINANMWLPQERKRLILIGTRKPFNNLKYPESKPIRLKDIIQKGAEVAIPQYVYNRINLIGNYRDKPIVSNPDFNDIAPCAVAHYGTDRSTRLVQDGNNLRPYTTTEFARLQGFPDEFKFSGVNSKVYKQIGNAVAVPMGKWVGEQALRYFG